MPEKKDARTASCPSCGAPLRFRGASSIVAVCGFCKSTLVREGAKLENIGKQADLLPDASPIRIGTDGRHKGTGFTVVGRIQYRYGAGLWNEWHVLVSDRTSAWLSDANGEYTITYLRPPEAVPEFASLKPGAQVKLDKGTFTVTNLEAAEVVAGEGELPFRFDGGWGANVVDLQGEGNRFATIDYSEGKPLVYSGEKLPFDAFSFSGLRDNDRIGFTTGRALAFKCGGCGAPVESHLTSTEVVACASCGTVTDVSKGVGEIVQKNELNLKAAAPSIPLGSAGSWKGIKYEVVGFLRKSTYSGDARYHWLEYLLHNTEQGYAWIVEYQGHFNFVKTAAELPKKGKTIAGKDNVTYLGRPFRHFASAIPTVQALAGEFYWRVKTGDEAETDDYVAPPLMLSSEKTGKEITWSLGEYVSRPAELWKAFGVKGSPPAPVGIYPNQPSPHTGSTGRYWKLMFILFGAAVLAQFTFMGMNAIADPAAKVPFSVEPGKAARTVSPVFKVGGVLPGPITLRIDTNADKSWVVLNMQLTDADSGKAYGVKHQVGVWTSGGRPEGGPDAITEILGVEPGRYTFSIDATAGAAAGNAWLPAVTGTVDVVKADTDWGNFWALAIFLLAWPIAATWRALSFETKRWAESDYAPVATLGSDSDSDDD